jgi:hypothetical protein
MMYTTNERREIVLKLRHVTANVVIAAALFALVVPGFAAPAASKAPSWLYVSGQFVPSKQPNASFWQMNTSLSSATKGYFSFADIVQLN